MRQGTIGKGRDGFFGSSAIFALLAILFVISPSGTAYAACESTMSEDDFAVYYDETARLDIKDVTRPNTSVVFSPSCASDLASPAIGDAIWIRFIAPPVKDDQNPWIVFLAQSQISRIDLFERQENGKFSEKSAGRAVPPGERNIVAMNPAIRLSTAPAANDFRYLRLEGTVLPTFTLKLLTQDLYQQSATVNAMSTAIFMGFIFAVFSITSIIYFPVRLVPIQYYCLYGAFVWTYELFYAGFFYQFTDVVWLGQGVDSACMLLITGACLSLTMFCRQVLLLRVHTPFADKLLRLAMYLVGGTGGIAIIDPAEYYWLLDIAVFTNIVLIFLIGIVRAFQGHTAAQPLAAAVLALVLGVGLSDTSFYYSSTEDQASTLFQLLASGGTDFPYYIGLCIEAILMSSTFAMLINQTRRESIEAKSVADLMSRDAEAMKETYDRKLNAVATRVAMLENTEPDAMATADKTTAADRFVQLASSHLRANIDNPDIDVATLATDLAVSEQTLRRRIKEGADLTPAAFIRAQRLEHARTLLENQMYKTVAEVGYAVGLTNPSHFARLYRDAYGESPGRILRSSERSNAAE